jgi:ectoine hydroxylase-related dioxygenase (phytanoyl-CoA dioxygenase family)
MKPEARGRNSEANGIRQFERDGFQIIKSLIEDSECDLLATELTPLFKCQQKSAKNKIGGLRNLLRTNSRVLQVANSDNLLSLLEQLLGSPVFPVRAIFFDKNPEANWVVPWHQDLAIAVAERIETRGFTGWSIKDETPHVHPPQEILENMVTVRLHLDDCDASNGALKVLPETHCHGKLSAVEIQKWTAKSEPVVCELLKGDALLMRPLLLHASSPAENPKHRRVLHIEYAMHELPNGLEWFDRK